MLLHHRLVLGAASIAMLGACSTEPGVGVYHVDVPAMQQQLQRLAARLPAEHAEVVYDHIEEMLASLQETEFDLRPDKTFVARTRRQDGSRSNISGTWSVDGERITLLQTHQDGLPDHDERTGQFYDRVIRFVEGEGRDALEMVLRRTPATP